MNALLLVAIPICAAITGYGIAHAPLWLDLALGFVILWFVLLCRLHAARRPLLVAGGEK